MLPNITLEKVKEFLIRLVKDSAFYTQLQSSSADQIQRLLQDAGYTFSQEDFESATIQILDLKERNEFHDLTEDELIGAVGGWMRRFPEYPGMWPIKPIDPIIQPMYGVIIDPPVDSYPKPRPTPVPYPDPQPMYGVVIDPIIRPMYGVVTSSDIT